MLPRHDDRVQPREGIYMSSSNRGFTLVEIMIVVAVIGLLAVVAVPSYVNARTKSMQKACFNNLRLIDGAKDQFALEHTNSGPSTLADLVGTNAYIKNTPVCPASGNYTPNALGIKPDCDQHGTAP
jgi:prepilin-type N-terminal cleavage/methylation domain-containing protein